MAATPSTPAPAAVAEQHAIVLFDGLCNLCNGKVLFVIDRDPSGHFRFAPLQSELGHRLVAHHPEIADLESIVLLENGRCYVRSTAALRIARRLQGAWPAAYLLLLVPRPIRDAVYAWVARNRYRWFGRAEACRVPAPELAARFLR